VWKTPFRKSGHNYDSEKAGQKEAIWLSLNSTHKKVIAAHFKEPPS